MANGNGSTSPPADAAGDGGQTENPSWRDRLHQRTSQAQHLAKTAFIAVLIVFIFQLFFGWETALMVGSGLFVLLGAELKARAADLLSRDIPFDFEVIGYALWVAAVVLGTLCLLLILAPGDGNTNISTLALMLFIILVSWRFVEKSAIVFGVLGVAIFWIALRVAYGSSAWSVVGWGISLLPGWLVIFAGVVLLSVVIWALWKHIKDWGGREFVVVALLVAPVGICALASWQDFAGTLIPGANGAEHLITCISTSAPVVVPHSYTLAGGNCYQAHPDGPDGFLQLVRLITLIVSGGIVGLWLLTQPESGEEPPEDTDGDPDGQTNEPGSEEDSQQALFAKLFARDLQQRIVRTDGYGFLKRAVVPILASEAVTQAELDEQVEAYQDYRRKRIIKALRTEYLENPDQPLAKNKKAFYVGHLNELFKSPRAPQLVHDEAGVTPSDLKEDTQEKT